MHGRNERNALWAADPWPEALHLQCADSAACDSMCFTDAPGPAGWLQFRRSPAGRPPDPRCSVL